MENEKSTHWERKKYFYSRLRKRKKILLAGIGIMCLLALLAGGIFISIVWRAGHNHMTIRSRQVTLAAKDFESMGIIFAESGGARMTYNALMREAARLGADGITNVNIFSSTESGDKIWYGSALAIRYLDSVPVEYRSSRY